MRMSLCSLERFSHDHAVCEWAYNKAELKQMAESVGFWWHSIDLGHGVVTKGFKKTPETLQSELESLRLPDLRDKTVLDIGAWDGFFSFEAEKRGAKRVVAFDHHIWSVDLAAPSAPNNTGAKARPVEASPSRFKKHQTGSPTSCQANADTTPPIKL